MRGEEGRESKRLELLAGRACGTRPSGDQMTRREGGSVVEVASVSLFLILIAFPHSPVPFCDPARGS